MTRFELVSTGLLRDGSIWQLNRPIDITFNDAVDFGSLDANTIQIYSVATGFAATGTWSLKPGDEGRTIRFQPRCPTNATSTDGGFVPGGRAYRLVIPTSAGRSGTVLRSLAGKPLTLGGTRTFRTPTNPPEYFLDLRPNAPPALHEIALGTQRVYPDPATGGVPQYAVPIDLNRFTAPWPPLVLTFDQALSPRSGNVSADNIQIVFREGSGPEIDVPVTVTMIENCGEPGARVLVTPEGILPPATTLELVVRRELEDLGGERASQDARPLRLITEAATSHDLDVVFEDFTDTGLEDENAPFAEPRATWGPNGELLPATAFDGTNTDFDWEVNRNTTIDTNLDFITDITRSRTIVVQNGIVDVRSIRIRPGVTLSVVGPHPLILLATGSITVEGTIVVTGPPADGVRTLCSAYIPESGAQAVCGGGDGGDASWETTTSTPRGGHGNGAFNVPDIGGQGGESGYGDRNGAMSLGHRPAGGGGGSFGTRGTAGIDGGPTALGAVTNQAPPRGGRPGEPPFGDPDPGNDFFGLAYDPATGVVTRGELREPTGGQGGGAGGDAVQWTSFPNPNWNDPNTVGDTCDIKGGNAGAGGGVFVLKALGPVIISGRVESNGGAGGRSERFLGGGGGGGSGGHIILMSGTRMDLTGATLVARGGPGGVGEEGSPFPARNAGGPGGDGVIQVHVPDPSRDLVPAQPQGTPTPWVLTPDYGALSRAQSRWIRTGFTDPGSASYPDPPLYLFPGTRYAGIDPVTGDVQRDGRDQVIHPGSAFTARVPRTAVASHTITIAKTELPDISNWQALRRWELVDAAAPQEHAYTVLTVHAAQDDVRLDMDPLDGDLASTLQFMEDTAIVEFHPRFYEIRTDGRESAFPPSVAIRFEFQGADPDPNDAMHPDLSTVVPDPRNLQTFTGDVQAIDGKSFVRFRVTFDLDANGQGLRRNSPRPSLRFLALPFHF